MDLSLFLPRGASMLSGYGISVSCMCSQNTIRSHINNFCCILPNSATRREKKFRKNVYRILDHNEIHECPPFWLCDNKYKLQCKYSLQTDSRKLIIKHRSILLRVKKKVWKGSLHSILKNRYRVRNGLFITQYNTGTAFVLKSHEEFRLCDINVNNFLVKKNRTH